jgi:hypothetical protein
MIRSYHSCVFFMLLLVLSGFSNGFSFENDEERLTAIERISVEDARARIQAGEAFLVCAYDDKRCKGLMLKFGIDFRQVGGHLPGQGISEQQGPRWRR